MPNTDFYSCYDSTSPLSFSVSAVFQFGGHKANELCRPQDPDTAQEEATLTSLFCTSSGMNIIYSPARNSVGPWGVFGASAPNRHENQTFNPDSSDLSLWNPHFLQVGIFQLRILRDFVGWVFVCLWWLTTQVSSMSWL